MISCFTGEQVPEGYSRIKVTGRWKGLNCALVFCQVINFQWYFGGMTNALSWFLGWLNLLSSTFLHCMIIISYQVLFGFENIDFFFGGGGKGGGVVCLSSMAHPHLFSILSTPWGAGQQWAQFTLVSQRSWARIPMKILLAQHNFFYTIIKLFNKLIGEVKWSDYKTILYLEGWWVLQEIFFFPSQFWCIK